MYKILKLLDTKFNNIMLPVLMVVQIVNSIVIIESVQHFVFYMKMIVSFKNVAAFHVKFLTSFNLSKSIRLLYMYNIVLHVAQEI
jgi:hypothetical protein